MELGELRLALRRDILDDATAPYLWSDAALASHFNDAQRQICLRARAMIDSTSSVTNYAIAAGERRVRLHPSILAVRHARLAGCGTLSGITAKRLWKREPGWDTSDAAAATHWVPDYQDGYLYLDRPVVDATTLRLSVWRLPTDVEEMEDDSDEPVIPLHWHMDMLDWAAFRAFSVKDSEMFDEARAGKHLAAFEGKAGRLPSMLEVRLWGISPIVGVPAEFL